jgi:hypothetical protein
MICIEYIVPFGPLEGQGTDELKIASEFLYFNLLSVKWTSLRSNKVC